MKKRRVQISPVPEEVYMELVDNPVRVFQFLGELNIEVPEKAFFMLMCLKITNPKLDLRLYTTQEQYLQDYTKCLLKDKDDYEFYSFRRDENIAIWEMFLPPPVIGLGISTRLRPGTSHD